MASPPTMVTIPLADEEVLTLLREESLSVLISALKEADPTFRAHHDGPLLDAQGLRVGRRSYASTAHFLSLPGHANGFVRVVSAIREAATARGWT